MIIVVGYMDATKYHNKHFIVLEYAKKKIDR